MRRTLLALVLAAATFAAHAALFGKKPEDAAAEAARAGMTAVTIWVDVNWGLRTQGAANALNRAHQAFAAHGYRVLDVEPYIENNDLVGFFVTYQKP
ncbi:hypothetical protein [Vulcaniibacterium gelatinicum]|uniref:hypothetical protein n=1 Tax=Vulcaniibacterium gelatinicum TaxID=2598725 RepID=UPI0011C95821|nr:hypothetical protein [Vulcaniibacterium gelatinicum]